MSLIYFPEEDSFLMSEILENEIPKLLKKNISLSVLEVGSGSGIQLETLFKKGVKKECILGTDINPDAVKKCNSLGFNCIHSNLFSKINKKFDLIIFNPPYLPEDSLEPKESKLITTGGKNGSELINSFIEKSNNYLNKNGKIFLLVSSLTNGINFFQYKKKILGRKKIFFEELFVYELKL